VRTTWWERVPAPPALIPPIDIFDVVVSSIYVGIATPTEATSLGVVAAMGLAAANRKLTIDMLHHAIESTCAPRR